MARYLIVEAGRQNSDDPHQKCLVGRSANRMEEEEVGTAVVVVREEAVVDVFREAGVKGETHGIKIKNHSGVEEAVDVSVNVLSQV